MPLLEKNTQKYSDLQGGPRSYIRERSSFSFPAYTKSILYNQVAS